MKMINKILIIIISIISYIISLISLKHGLTVDFLKCITILPILLVPKLLNKIGIKITIKFEFIYLLFIFLAYFLGVIINIYDTISFYDTIMHFLTGIFGTYVAFYILNLINCYDKNKIILNVLFVLGFVSFISIAWEVFEYISSILFKVDPQKVIETGVNDTMKDLMIAITGSIITCILYIKNKNLINRCK